MFLLLFPLVGNPAVAEVIDGPANFRGSPKGKIVASIDDGVVVTPEDYEGGWYKVAVSVYVKKADIQADPEDQSGYGLIKANRVLYDGSGRKIGRTAAPVRIEFGPDETADKYFGVIQAYTFHQNIRPESLVEPEIERLLSSAVLSMKAGWAKLIDRQNYQYWLAHKDFNSYIYFNPLGVEIHPEPRTILFFYKDRLFAIYHTQPIQSEKFVAEQRARDGAIEYISGFGRDVIRDFNAFYPVRLNLAN